MLSRKGSFTVNGEIFEDYACTLSLLPEDLVLFEIYESQIIPNFSHLAADYQCYQLFRVVLNSAL